MIQVKKRNPKLRVFPQRFGFGRADLRHRAKRHPLGMPVAVDISTPSIADAQAEALRSRRQKRSRRFCLPVIPACCSSQCGLSVSCSGNAVGRKYVPFRSIRIGLDRPMVSPVDFASSFLPVYSYLILCVLTGVERTLRGRVATSAFDSKGTSS